MCSREEVQSIVSKAETRLEKQIESLETHQNKRLEDSHMALSRSISNFGADIKSIEVKIKEYIDLKTSPIIDQVMKTNGRVSFNEKMIWLAMGAIMILAPLFSWFLLDYIEFKQQLNSQIEKSVTTTLDNYEFEIAK